MPQSRLQRARVLKWYWLFVVISTAIASGAAAFVIHKDYVSRRSDAGQKAMMFAQALAEQTTQVVASLDALSKAVIQDVQDRIVDESLMSEVLKRRANAQTKAVIGIALVNRFGLVTASGVSTVPVGLDLSHSAEFRTLSYPGSLKVFFNHPNSQEINTPKSCDGQTMTYSRTIYDAQGRFSGMILILVNEHYLYSFYDRFVKEPDIVLGLVGSDGVIRASNYGFAIGHNIKSYIEKELTVGQGIQVRDSPIVDYRQIFAYYKSSAAPLWAYAGFPTAPIKASWLLASGLTIFAIFGLFIVMVACGIVLAKYLKSQEELLKRDFELIKEKQELEIFETIATASDIVMVVTNDRGDKIVANQNFLDAFGAENSVNGPSVSTMLGIDLEALRQLPSWQGTHNIHLPNGHRREMSWVVSIIRDPQSKNVRNFVILGLDITERREAELAVYQSAKMLTLGQMATGIAHELSQPLATLAIMLDNMDHSIANKTPDLSSFREQINEMSAQVDRASSIAQHMRIYGHKGDGALSVVDPSMIIESVLTICKEHIESDGIVINKIIDESTNVVGNTILIEQILLNFMVNARDSICSKGQGSAPSNAQITITLKQLDTDYVDVCVRDNGTGMDDDVVKKLFDPFFTTKPVGQGMGLGLPLCYGMAKDMRGSIEAKNTGDGAVFILKLPAAHSQLPGGKLERE